MKKITLLGIWCVLLSSFATSCSQKPAAFTEGIISEVRWAVSDMGGTTYTLRRVDKADAGTQYKGGVEMYGVLYPGCLEVRFGKDRDSHVQIIPLSQITWLEFGEGGRAMDKK